MLVWLVRLFTVRFGRQAFTALSTNDDEATVDASGEASDVEGAAPSPGRPFGHILRCVVLLVGIFLQFLLVNVVPKSDEIARSKLAYPTYDSYREGLYMIAVGSVIVQVSVVGLIGLVVKGHDGTKQRNIGLVLLVFYSLGALLSTVGLGICTHQSWDWVNQFSQTSYRATMVGTLMGEAFITTAGLLMLLPDFGVLRDWSDSGSISGRPLGHIMRQVVLHLGIFFHFLLAGCVPRVVLIDNLPDRSHYSGYRDDLYISVVGSGIIQGSALLLLGIVLWGMQNEKVKRAGFVLLTLYVSGAFLNALGMWKASQTTWNWHWKHQSQSAARAIFVGTVASDLCYAVAGLLILLPDFGLFKN